MRISDWSSDVCSSDLFCTLIPDPARGGEGVLHGGREPVLRPHAVVDGNHRPAGPVGQMPTDAVMGVDVADHPAAAMEIDEDRSEEHTSELQSLMRISYAVFCLKKKKNKNRSNEPMQVAFPT